MASDFTEFWSGTFLGSLFTRGGNNNQYISQPNFYTQPLNLSAHEQWQTITGNEREVYLTTPELRIIIDRLAMMYANGKWEHLDENGEPIEDSEFVELLENPNAFQSRNEFLAQWFIQRCLYGNVYNYQLLSGSSFQVAPSALWNLPPSRITIKRTGLIWNQTDIADMISHYTLKNDDHTDTMFSTDEIIQFSMPNSDDPLIGVSPLNALKMPISNIRAGYGTNNVILSKKGAFGALSSDAKDGTGAMPLTSDEIKNISDQYTKDFGIGDHQSKIMVVAKALKWTPFTYPTKELMIFETIDAGKKAIIDLYGANENMFSRGSKGQGSTFNNVEMGERQCYQNTLFPIANDQGYGYSSRWGLLDKGERLVLSYDHLPVLKEDEVRKSQVLERKARAAAIISEGGFMSPEEIHDIFED